ncbi:MAG: DNA polymerase III subunit alpha [Sphaerochaetaceae bacterium]
MPSRLGLCSSYSLLYGLHSPKEIVAKAVSYGITVLSITDRDNLYGVHAFIEAAQEAGVRPVIGAQLYLPAGVLSAFVRNRQGFSRLCELLTLMQASGNQVLEESVRQDADGLVIVSRSPRLLGSLAGRMEHLYAGITSNDLGAVPTARAHHLPLAALDEALFFDKEDLRIHAALRAIALGKTVGNLNTQDKASCDGMFLDTETFRQDFSSWPEALQGTEEIASLCTFDRIFEGFVFPGYPTSPGEDPQMVLRQRVLQGAEQRYGELSDAILQRIDYELDIIGRKGFASYFLVMDDIVSMASRTCGRGSGAASIVSYALGITNVDPIAYKLYFERFLTMARPDPPDIDVDFAWDEREALMREVIKRFGSDHCARVANHNMFRPRSAVRETAKAYGLPDGEITRMEHHLFNTGDVQKIADPLWREILTVASSITGLPRGMSMHCGGMVITPRPICSYAPIGKSADGFPLLAWEKEGTEAAGLVKIDLLGNRSLAVIRDALENLKEEGTPIDPLWWRPAEDQSTIDALARGDSLGVFYIESPAMRQLQKKTGKGDFDHIVIHSSIIRPAANKYITEYVRRLKGGAWNPLHPRLAYILDETYGILCYQEDVSKTAVALAGFSEADADKLRKVIAKKGGPAKLSVYEQQFFSGCRDNGVDETVIKEVWDMMLSFDGYSFCKPHSASYAMVSFQSAYLRVHHPAPFMAAVLSNQGGFYRPQAYISECRRMGLRIEGPDINQSRYRYHGEGTTVIVGLMAIARLSHSGALSVVTEREHRGCFNNLAEARGRLRLSREDVVSLVACGAFDSLAPGMSRSAQIRLLLTSTPSTVPGGQGDLFSNEPKLDFYQRPPLHIPPPSPLSARDNRSRDQELHDEFQALGFLRNHHPLLLWSRQISTIRRIRACEIPAFVNRKVSLLGWPVTQKEVWTKEGSTMDFVSFEDETALYETVLFPQVFERFRTLLFGQQPLIVVGTVKNDQGALNVEVAMLKAVGEALETGYRSTLAGCPPGTFHQVLPSTFSTNT